VNMVIGSAAAMNDITTAAGMCVLLRTGTDSRLRRLTGLCVWVAIVLAS
jgi:hypothetical protein